VTLQVIVHSLSGYLLLGTVFAIGTIMISQWNVGAYNFNASESHDVPLFSDCMYYTFITFTTTGYGDLLPILPVARSFAIWIAACGQLYIAVIIALLVGKYSGASVEND
jgi:voltage-gated potassium channel